MPLRWRRSKNNLVLAVSMRERMTYCHLLTRPVSIGSRSTRNLLQSMAQCTGLLYPLFFVQLSSSSSLTTGESLCPCFSLSWGYCSRCLLSSVSLAGGSGSWRQSPSLFLLGTHWTIVFISQRGTWPLTPGILLLWIVSRCV